MATVRVNQNGKAPSGLKVGDKVVTGGGTYEIKGINADGSYKSSLADKSQTTSNSTREAMTGRSRTRSSRR